MKSLLIFLLLATAWKSVHGQVRHGNSTTHDDDTNDGTSFTSKATFSLGSILLFVLVAWLIWYLCKRKESEPPPQRLQNEDDLTDPNGPTRPRQNNRRRRWWNRRNRNHFHQTPNMSPNVIVQPVINVGINPQDISPPVGEGMLRNPGLPNVPPPPAYSEMSDSRAPNLIPKANCATQTNDADAPNFSQQPPAFNANLPFMPNFGQTTISTTAYVEKQDNSQYTPNRY